MSSKIAVDYTVSYLAGEEKKRPNFLRNLVLKSVLMGESVGDNIVPAYLNGHYFRNKRYLKWVAKPDGYNDAVGLGPLMVLAPMDSGALATAVSQIETLIPNPDNHQLQISDVQTRQIAAEDYADQYIRQHRPELANRNYSVETTDTADTVFAIYVAPQGQPAPELPAPTSGVEETITFTEPNAKVGSLGLIAQYTLQSKPSAATGHEPFIAGTASGIDFHTSEPIPPAGYTYAPPDEVIGSVIWREYRQLIVVQAFTPEYPNGIRSHFSVMRIGENTAVPDEWYSQSGEIYVQALHVELGKIYIYPVGSGDAVLDGVVTDYTSNSMMEAIASPPRPLVINHTRIDELGDTINVGHRKHHINTPWAIIRKAANNYTGNDPNPAYKLVNMATRKQTQRGVRKILKEVVNHAQFDDMSYVYYFDGVPINTKRKYLSRYVYEYFRGFGGTGFDVNDRVQEILDYNNKVGAYYAYLEAVEAKAKGTATPAQIALADGPQVLPPEPLNKGKTTEIRWGKDNDFASWIHYSLAMRGDFGSETVISGTQHNPYFNRPAKPREAWVTTANHAIKDASKLIGHVGADVTNFYYQEDANTCRTFSVVNLEFEKWVWRWGYVITTAAEAMEDPDESKFFCLILNQPLKTIGLVPATQVLVESPILEIDIYVQKRQKFGFKQIIGFIIGVIVSVFFPPAGGYYFGMTGIWGAVVTTAVNMVVGAMIASAATKLFGGTVGALIGALVMMYTMNVMGGGTTNFMQLMKDSMGDIQTWAKLMDAVSDAFRAHAMEKIAKVQGQYENYLKELKEEKSHLAQLEQEAGLTGLGGVDAQAVTQALNGLFWGESPESFLHRTRLYGTDMVQEVLNFVTRFSENQLALR